ncbi:LicD family protein [Atlantibacter sp. RC6]|uniref:LicD family protein n=1 Tax=Atlantibacter sp. RC6 TaxID=2587036 RepID=UPI001606359B|nr:LicD family protein [Atlantibacter sp. RC6]MBB3322575.1 tetratricopeptide (TPR) repeat protein [Atlantibacter sp. RC6]
MNSLSSGIILRLKKSRNEAKQLKSEYFGGFFACLCSMLIERGYSKELIRSKKLIAKINNPVVNYYLARAYFLNGKYKEVVLCLENTIDNNCHAESYYLLSESYRILNDRAKSWDILRIILCRSKRLKTWLYMANLVDSKEEFLDLYALWHSYQLKNIIPKYHYELNGYIATAALRAKQFDYSLAIWKDFINNIPLGNCVFPTHSKKQFSLNAANDALKDLRTIFNDNNIEFFLISGTLLGCIRNGQLLSHDKDIDVGIWYNSERNNLINILSSSGYFEFHAFRSQHVIRIKHVNGISIDVFYHYKEQDNYWHGGVKLKWNNTPFLLKDHRFLGVVFKIPENYDLYLTENYGNWKIEQKDFDSAFGTPNAEILNRYEMKAHIYKCMALSLHSGENFKIKSLQKKLDDIDSNVF